MKLIAGYLHPNTGTLSVLGNPLATTALKTYYPHIGYLTQEPGVFDATIRENLISALGKEGKQAHQKKKSSKVRNESNISALSPSESHISNELRLKATETSTEEFTTEERLIQALKLAKCDFVFELEK